MSLEGGTEGGRGREGGREGEGGREEREREGGEGREGEGGRERSREGGREEGREGGMTVIHILIGMFNQRITLTVHYFMFKFDLSRGIRTKMGKTEGIFLNLQCDCHRVASVFIKLINLYTNFSTLLPNVTAL